MKEALMNICQSCSMPMTSEAQFGKNSDGSKNQAYCTFCYPEGQFNKPDETLEEMIESCVPFMMKEGHSEVDARASLKKILSGLKRWQ